VYQPAEQIADSEVQLSEGRGLMACQHWPAMLPARQVRIARPTDQLDELVRFYRDGLGLFELDRFAGHAGYRGVLLGLPGADYHLEFTEHDKGSPCPAPSRDNLLVISFDDQTEMGQVVVRLAGLGYPPVSAENPYWTDHGAVIVEDPDRWRVVLMPALLIVRPEPPVVIEWYTGDRASLRPLSELAEDSLTQLESYLCSGRVLAARTGQDVVGYLQLVGLGRPDAAEIKSMAVREDLQGRGIGRRLVHTARSLLVAEGASQVRVATAAANLDNLRFYQRCGFRLRAVERDAFTPAAGYPPDGTIAGIPLRDRVWLDMQLDGAAVAGAVANEPPLEQSNQ
jgi:ribosomal protein S18 acetylase RimI-like enzyme